MLKGYTGHSFNDFNHVDLTAMNDNNSDNLNDGEVRRLSLSLLRECSSFLQEYTTLVDCISNCRIVQ